MVDVECWSGCHGQSSVETRVYKSTIEDRHDDRCVEMYDLSRARRDLSDRMRRRQTRAESGSRGPAGRLRLRGGARARGAAPRASPDRMRAEKSCVITRNLWLASQSTPRASYNMFILQCPYEYGYHYLRTRPDAPMSMTPSRATPQDAARDARRAWRTATGRRTSPRGRDTDTARLRLVSVPLYAFRRRAQMGYLREPRAQS